MKLRFSLLVFLVLAVWLLSGAYQVGPSEVGLVLRFGKFVARHGPGFHYHLPFPIEKVIKVDVKTLRKVEIGFRTISVRPLRYRDVEEEALMLTGDGNVVSVEAVIRYRVKDPYKFVFKLLNEVGTIKFVTESVLREEVAQRTIDEVLTTKREEIAEITARRVQKILDEYDVGVAVEGVFLQDVAPPDEVADAFYDVINAQQDKERSINDAKKYANDKIPKAEGEAQKILNDAEAYMQETILAAQGETSRFLKVYEEYRKAPEITRTKLKIDAIREILKNNRKVLILTRDGSLKLLDLSKIVGEEGKR